ncbi:flagellin [Pararhizobium sp. YC-54]|uniref:flagellin N-terminal helical domain-containing protein n=1 Tax=Pararhizobium sp. YC-54 TaxID=2986920 RepID=UPI0021F7A8BA|nr:flagellin [Pararhizobium sp. YC-54]MCV9997310.1 flagellin [Pararhizobium sp. YC-54]
MTSILTNASATSALQVLRSLSSSMQDTQREVSSGLRVGTASDNAAYWSIATTMRSDNKALSVVQDALGLGAGMVDTAYAGLEGVVDVISEMKSKIIVATEEGVDREKVQAEIEQLKGQLTSIVASSSFSGVNWLSTDGNVRTSVVASAARDAKGNFGVQTIAVDLGAIALFTATDDGLLQKSPPRTYGDFEDFTTPTNTYIFTKPFKLYDGDEFQFDIQDGALLYTATVTKALFDAYAGPDGVVDDYVDFWNVLAQSAGASGPGFFGSGNQAFGNDFPNPVSFSNFRVTGTASMQIMDVDVVSENDMGALLSRVDGWLEDTIAAAATVGALSSRISMQEEFLNRLSDSIDSGIAKLVDADMDTASTKLKALQTQEQLAIQSLSIANTNPENILSLFR